MKRGEIRTISDRGPYTNKPRPAVILQSDRFDSTDSITICLFTTDPSEAPFLRLRIEPDNGNGLRDPSRLMIDKISTVRRNGVGERIGALSAVDMQRLDIAVARFLGLAG